jgi:hypothetical protein|tara:strand:- start:683 stop:940 length:258 start_codon:yes stop_codon:yes gene_type:complete
MIVCLDSGSWYVRKVGSSLLKRCNALEKFAEVLVSAGSTDNEITGSGTNIDVIATFNPSDANVSPDEQSTPNMAQISPAPETRMQ